MQQKIKIIGLVIAVFLLGIDLFGQHTVETRLIASLRSPGNCPQEKIAVHISQESVFSGELVWFKIYCTSTVIPREKLSSLAFIELISGENSSILRKKILLEQGEGSGEFEIPDNLPTGLYYILAYTNWMKNFGEASFFRKEMIVVNPNLPINNEQDRPDSQKALEGTTVIDVTSNNLKIIPDKKRYSTHEQVTIKIETNRTKGKAISGDFSVSVYREEPQMIYDTEKSKNEILIKNPDKITYLPDYKGIRLSGKLMDASENSVSGAIVTESTPGPGTNIKRSKTDSKGAFNFLLKPKEGEQEIIFTLPDAGTKISLEESFWNGFRDPPDHFVFNIGQEALSYLKVKFKHFQLQSRFKRQHSIQMPQDKILKDSSVFYSKPFQVIKFKDYYILDSLREYFYELVPTVKFTQRKKEIDISFIDPLNMSFLEDKPGVFVDGIFYNDYATIANIPVKEIDRIAILPKTYCYKDFTFGGIIDIHTKKSDFNSVKPLPNMTRIIFPMANASEWKFTPPDYSISGSKDKVPDFRYLLHWESNVKIENSGEAKIQFYTGDLKGRFIVKIIGRSEDGEILQADNEIIIK
jgi:hypothetical protein